MTMSLTNLELSRSSAVKVVRNQHVGYISEANLVVFVPLERRSTEAVPAPVTVHVISSEIWLFSFEVVITELAYSRLRKVGFDCISSELVMGNIGMQSFPSLLSDDLFSAESASVSHVGSHFG